MQFLLHLFWYIHIITALSCGGVVHQTHLQDVGWIKGDQVNDNVIVLLTLALSQPDQDRAIKYLLEVSDPHSPHYSKYWNASEVTTAFAIPSEAFESVLQWISDTGIESTQMTRIGNDIHISCTARTAEVLLSTKIHHYRQSGQQQTLIAYDSYTLPHTINKYLDWVLPSLTSFPGTSLQPPHSRDSHRLPWRASHTTPDVKNKLIRRRKLVSERGCTYETNPSCVSRLYRIPIDDGAPDPRNTFGIFAPGWSTWLPDDLDNFFDQFAPKLTGRRPIIASINGGYRQTEIQSDAFNLEPNMDMEYAMALTHPQPVINFQVGDSGHPGNLNTMLAAFDRAYAPALNATYDPIEGLDDIDYGTLQPPNVLSISYVWSESLFPPEYLKRQCLEFLKLGLQGTTVIVSAGDAGPAKHPEGTCINDKTGSPDAAMGGFVPSWPAACPWITVVGGTTIKLAGQNDEATLEDEPVAYRNLPSMGGSQEIQAVESTYIRLLNGQWRSSGGGFSNIFAAPAYQVSLVEKYLAREDGHLSRFKDHFNASGRAYPDVAAVATSVQVVTGGELKSVFGTSSSAPIFASIIAKINNKRLLVGKKPVGFINPVLYAHPEALNDVVTGHNSGCGVLEAFKAAEGWDAVTGLGSPDYEKLLQVFMSLP